jgi:hypothetical protein
MKNLIGAEVNLHLNLVDNHYTKLNKSNTAGLQIKTSDKTHNLYFNHATKKANERGQAVPFNKFLSCVGYTEKTHSTFRRALKRKLPSIQECYYSHIETEQTDIFAVLEMTQTIICSLEPELFVVIINKQTQKYNVFTTARQVSFNRHDRFKSTLIKAPMYNHKAREENIIKATSEEVQTIANTEKLELELENEEMKRTIEDLRTELLQRDQNEAAKVKDLVETVDLLRAEIEQLKSEQKKTA